jgi:hypothetical protein
MERAAAPTRDDRKGETMRRRWPVGLALAGLLAGCGDSGGDRRPAAAPTSAPTPATIPYRVVQTWDIFYVRPSGRRVVTGHGRVVVVDSTVRNEADLRRLGQQLHAEAPTEGTAHVEVFDDSVAASRRQQGAAEKLSPAQQRHFDRHLIGAYNRNHGNGGIDFWIYGLNGVANDPTTEVTY